MATLREIRRRIKSVRNIAKVTRAMEMVAAARMRRAQQSALALRLYVEKAEALLVHLAMTRGASPELHPLLTRRPAVNRRAVIMVTSNRGLAGGYNHNVVRVTDEYIEQSDAPVDLITVGRVGRSRMLRGGRHILADFEDLPDQPGVIHIAPIARLAMDGFLSGEFDEVSLAYTHFVNTAVQVPMLRQLLPLRHELSADPRASQLSQPAQEQLLLEYIYEPSPNELLDMILPRFTELQVYGVILQALASEHSARMMAMRAATDNANELIGDLTLSYNRARQDAITKEVLDIVGGTEALAQAEAR